MKCGDCKYWSSYASIYDSEFEDYDIGECWPVNVEFCDRKCGVHCEDKVCDDFVCKKS